MGKKDNLSDFKHSMADPARPTGLRISEQGFSPHNDLYLQSMVQKRENV